MIINSVNVWEL